VKGFKGVTKLEVLDKYWGMRARLVLDTRLDLTLDHWADETDHDHCAIHWATILKLEYRDHYVTKDGE
jgi:hypothetical protein